MKQIYRKKRRTAKRTPRATADDVLECARTDDVLERVDALIAAIDYCLER